MSVLNFPTKKYTFQAPKRIIAGPETSESIGLEAKQMHATLALLVTDETVRTLGFADRVRGRLSEGDVEVDIYDEVEAEPSLESIERASEAGRTKKYDLIVGLGGGSSLDTAKVVAMMATNSGEARSYIGGVGKDLVKKPTLQKILMPTTAGTGAEVTSHSVLTVSGSKTSIGSSYMFADVVMVDPLLTMTMPPKITAGTGMDALSHAIESMMATESNPATDSLALEAIRLVANNLPLAHAQGDNLEARCNMSWAALLAGLSLNAQGTYGHGMAHPVATRYHLHHGTACALALPYVMEFNLPACTLGLARVAEAMGKRLEGLTTKEKAMKAVMGVKELMVDLDMVSCLKDMQVPRSMLEEFANEVIEKYQRPYNPRKLTKEYALRIYEKMWEGKSG